jgi:hypothetical protein
MNVTTENRKRGKQCKKMQVIVGLYSRETKVW